VPGPVSGLAVSEDGVWVSGGDDDTVTLLDATNGAVLTSLDVAAGGCNQPEAITVGASAVWVACRASGSVLRIDPQTRTVSALLATGGAPADLAADDDGRVWVAVGPP